MSHSLTSKKAAIALFAGIAAFALAALALTGCSSSNNSNSDDKKITVAAVPTPHAEILNNAVAPILEKEGYTLEVKEFTDYVQPNGVTENGDVDANYFQHGPYLDNFNQEKGTHLVSVTAIHFEPMGIYSKSISDLTGACTAQSGTIWYDSCLPQIPGADIQTQAETAPAMIMAVESGTVDFICTDMPTAMGACATYDDLTILDGISIEKGNTALKDAMNDVLSTMTAEDFNQIMQEAIAVQPEI